MRWILTLLLIVAASARASSLDRAALKAVLQRASPQFKRCYERALTDRPELSGRASLRLEIAASGRVTEVTVEFPVEAPRFTQCLRDAAAKLQFLKGPAPYKVAWPIVFNPE